MKSKLKEIRPIKMWAAVSNDSPNQIWEVGPYKEHLQSNLRKIRVMVTPIVPKKRK